MDCQDSLLHRLACSGGRKGPLCFSFAGAQTGILSCGKAPASSQKHFSEMPGHTTRPGTQRTFASSPARCHLPRFTSALSRMRTQQDLRLHKLTNLIIPPVQRARRHRQMTLKGMAENPSGLASQSWTVKTALAGAQTGILSCGKAPASSQKHFSQTPGHTTRPGTQRAFASSPARCHLPRCTSALSRMRTQQDLRLHKLTNLIIPPVQRARRHQARRVSPALSRQFASSLGMLWRQQRAQAIVASAWHRQTTPPSDSTARVLSAAGIHRLAAGQPQWSVRQTET